MNVKMKLQLSQDGLEERRRARKVRERNRLTLAIAGGCSSMDRATKIHIGRNSAISLVRHAVFVCVQMLRFDIVSTCIYACVWGNAKISFFPVLSSFFLFSSFPFLSDCSSLPFLSFPFRQGSFRHSVVDGVHVVILMALHFKFLFQIFIQLCYLPFLFRSICRRILCQFFQFFSLFPFSPHLPYFSVVNMPFLLIPISFSAFSFFSRLLC